MHALLTGYVQASYIVRECESEAQQEDSIQNKHECTHRKKHHKTERIESRKGKLDHQTVFNNK